MIKITDKTKCCGCTACQQACPKQCISMQEDSEGFLYPKADSEVCIDCGICEKVCPVINRFDSLSEKPASYACVSLEKDIVAQSASGGLFTMIAAEVIRRGGVVFGAAFQNDWSVSHEYTETYEGLSKFRGSKYVQSNLGDSYSLVKEFLIKERYVLFSGTPCQISGLNHFLRKQYEKLITVDFVCHSVPSPKIWQMYLKSVSRGGEVNYVTFRDKSLGWERFGLVVKGKDFDGKETTFVQGDHHVNPYMRGFLEDLFVRPCCQQCPARNYTTGSDLTIADCWGFNKYHKDIATQDGMSLALLNTKKGTELYNSIVPYMQSMPIPYNEVEETKLHSPLTRSTPPHPERAYFYKKLTQENIEPLLSECLRRFDRKKRRHKMYINIIRRCPFFNYLKKIKTILKSKY